MRSIVIDLTPESGHEAERTEQRRQATEVEKQNQTAESENQTVDILEPTSETDEQTVDNGEQTADTMEQAVDTEGQTPDTEKPTADNEKQPADTVEQKTDIEEQVQTADTENGQIDQSVSAVSLLLEDKEENEEMVASDNSSQDSVAMDDSVSVKDSVADDYTLRDSDIDRILRSAGGREQSRERIYPKYCLNYTPTYRADFLRREYGVVGKGFTIGGHRISVWFDEQGMRAGLGDSAWKNTVLVLDWAAVEEKISRMIASGEYLPASVVERLEQEEKTRMAEKIIGYVEMCCKINPKIKMRSELSHTELVAFIKEVLGNDASIDTIKYTLDPFEKAIQNAFLKKGIWHYRKRFSL